MQIQVRYFAVVRERLAREEETLSLPEAASVGMALDELSRRHAVVGALRSHLRVAVNQSFVGLDQLLADGDELALIPPVAGGGDERLARVVSERPPTLAAVVSAVQRTASGAIVTFTGVVRRESRGKKVVRLEYEAYAEMAERVFRELCEEIEAEIPGCRIAVEHRVGILAVGDVAVVIAACAPHRKAAFRACEVMIDRLKESAPIWKKEVSDDGESWIGLGP